MRSFCVECGREGAVYRGLCARCLPNKRPLLELPQVLDLARCKHCGSYRLPGGWREAPPEDALESIVSKAVGLPQDVLHYHLKIGTDRQDERRLDVHVEARLELPGMEVTEEREVEVRVRKTVCPQCSRQKGEYYEAIIQVRAEDRDLTAGELEKVRHLVEERVRRDPGLFITREEELHGGLDVYLSSNDVAKSIVHELRKTLGGRVSSSPRLHTKRRGKDVYRVTYLLRLTGLTEGDAIELRGRVYQVLSPGEPALVVDLAEGERRTLRSRELLRARRLEAETVQGVVVSRTERELEVMDSEGYRVFHVPKPSTLELEGEEVTLLITSRGEFVVSPREVGRRAASGPR